LLVPKSKGRPDFPRGTGMADRELLEKMFKEQGFDACGFCETCAVTRTECKNPRFARPGADALGIDVYATVRKIGYPIQVLKEYKETMNRYAFLFIE
jgi:predicted metal-binding protein